MEVGVWLTTMIRSLNLELELPLTGLEKLEDVVGLPDFDDIVLDAYYPESQDSHFKEHFASQVALLRLTQSFNKTLRNGEFYQTWEEHGIFRVEGIITRVVAAAGLVLQEEDASVGRCSRCLPVLARHISSPGPPFQARA